MTSLELIIQISYLPNPSARAGYDTRSIFKRILPLPQVGSIVSDDNRC